MKTRPNKGIVLLGVAMGLAAWPSRHAESAVPGVADRPAPEEPAPPQSPRLETAPVPLPPPGEGWGPPGAGSWRGSPPPRWEQMDPEERNRLRSFIAEHFPLWAEEIDNLAGGDADLLARHMNRMLPEIVRLQEMSERDPELFGVAVKERRGQFQMRRLVQQYRRATDDAKKTELEGQIKALAAEQFDVRQQRMTLEMSRLEQRLAELRDNVARQATDRQEIIDHDVADILQGKKGDSGDRPHQFRDRPGRHRPGGGPPEKPDSTTGPKPEN
jgi:hypothetical protein